MTRLVKTSGSFVEAKRLHLFLQALVVLLVQMLIPLTGTASMEISAEDKLITAIRNGDSASVKMLLDQGVPTDLSASGSLLLEAAQEGHTEIVELLLDKKADIEARNRSRETPLIIAALGGHPAVVKLLLDRGANVDARNNVGGTALMMAASEGYLEIVKLLMEKGSDVNAADRLNRTPLMYAASEGDFETCFTCVPPNQEAISEEIEGSKEHRYDGVAELLLSKGAKVDVQDIRGETAFMLAARIDKAAVLEVFKAKKIQTTLLIAVALGDELLYWFSGNWTYTSFS